VVIGAVVLLGGLVVTVMTSIATREQSRATQDQVRLAEQGQYTDRFGKAVDQVGQPGPEKIDVRIGGIYALEHLVQNANSYQPTVMKVLTAFIRTHAKAEPFCPRDKASKPPEDIQATLSVLARRDPRWDGPSGIDLTHTCLTGAQLFQANFRGVDLNYAVLYNADLAHAELSDARLFRADLREASLNYARLFGVDRANADLRGADLSNVTGLK
jgi:hypothetical protein